MLTADKTGTPFGTQTCDMLTGNGGGGRALQDDRLRQLWRFLNLRADKILRPKDVITPRTIQCRMMDKDPKGLVHQIKKSFQKFSTVVMRTICCIGLPCTRGKDDNKNREKGEKVFITLLRLHKHVSLFNALSTDIIHKRDIIKLHAATMKYKQVGRHKVKKYKKNMRPILLMYLSSHIWSAWVMASASMSLRTSLLPTMFIAFANKAVRSSGPVEGVESEARSFLTLFESTSVSSVSGSPSPTFAMSSCSFADSQRL